MRFTGLRGSGSEVAYDDGEGRFVGPDAMVTKRLNDALREEKYGGLSALEIVRAEFGEQVQEVQVQVQDIAIEAVEAEVTTPRKKKQ